MAVTFQEYLERKRIDIAAQLIIETDFPIQELYDWYRDVGVYLPVEDGELVLEGFWSDTAKGAAGGAGIGAITGGGAGALVGGALGAVGGGAKHIGRAIQKWWNPNAYRINSIVRDKNEIIELLRNMQSMADEIRNDTNFDNSYAPGSITVHNPQFEKMLNHAITIMSKLEPPQLATPGSRNVAPQPQSQPTPQPRPQPTPPPQPKPQPAPKKNIGPASEQEMIDSPQFKSTMTEILDFAKSVGLKIDHVDNVVNAVAHEVWTALQNKNDEWPHILISFKENIIFDDNDPGYKKLASEVALDSKYNVSQKTLKRFYLTARLRNLGKQLGPSFVADEAKNILDKKYKPKP